MTGRVELSVPAYLSRGRQLKTWPTLVQGLLRTRADDRERASTGRVITKA